MLLLLERVDYGLAKHLVHCHESLDIVKLAHTQNVGLVHAVVVACLYCELGACNVLELNKEESINVLMCC